MLKISSSALLLSGVPSFVRHITEIAKDTGVELEVTDEWNINYRLTNDVVICGSKYLSCINPVDYYKVRLVLKTTETVSNFIEMGITHFIFDYNNVKEVAFSFFAEDRLDNINTVADIVTKTGQCQYLKGRYNFNFKTNKFVFDGVGIYLRESEKLYLAKWLLLNVKDNDKRILLCKMRKKFGKSFMSDVDRLGQYTRGNNE